MSDAILVAGIGNIFLGDDAFGVAEIRALRETSVPEGVRVADFGMRVVGCEPTPMPEVMDDAYGDECGLEPAGAARGARGGTDDRWNDRADRFRAVSSGRSCYVKERT